MGDTFIVPGGKVYFDPFDANGNRTGERYIGNTQGFVLNSSAEKIATYDNEDGVSVKADEVTTRLDRMGTMRTRSLDIDNLAMWVVSTASTKTQSSGSVTDEAISAVQQGRYYQLGTDASNPSGVRGISAVTVTDDTGTTTYVDGTDYTVDLTLARLYIVPGGSIADDSDLLVDYTKAANTRDQVVALSATTQQGAVRVIGSNLKGANRDYYMPMVNLTPTGDLDLKGDPESQRHQEIAFEVELLKKDTNTAPLYVDGRPA
ncbi:hypothetical protein [Thioalbus denitrificans]|uniref:Uncharacterized protein n=1 Tax=Thioalbus denitrificans TaxID=547122 RepID=A0A369CDU5_9GAMM|nr:hypothetical protein [Thioalbus denitrificans]RCX32079.1 hypothetical protein DFQ59_102432 [Thioalbus denitrificans]